MGRIATEIPIDAGWRIVLSPTGDGLLDLDSIQQADIHFLLLGGDIRSPIGQEWILAKHAGRQPIPYVKQGILRTSAAFDFYRHIQSDAIWKPFNDGSELRQAALLDISGKLLNYPLQYGLSLADLEYLNSWREGIKSDNKPVSDEMQSGTGSSSLILAPDAIATKGGVLLNKNPRE